jgi:predicted kinase
MKKVIILRGIPGSGKSTISSKYNGVICSADHFFEKSGTYIFDREKLGEAHLECMKKFINLCISGEKNIIVDNTNHQLVDLVPYLSVAKCFDYEVEIIRTKCSVETAFKRQKHGVPFDQLKIIDKNFQNLYKRFGNEIIIDTE